MKSLITALGLIFIGGPIRPHMQPLKSITLLLGAGVIAFFISPVFAGELIPATGPKSDYSDLTGNMPAPEYHDDVPTKATAARMLDQLAYQRAVQMYLWALPAVGMEQYRMADIPALGGGDDQYKLGYLGGLLKGSLFHLTGNPDSMYIDYFFDTHNGPIVLEVPPTLPGFLDDMWESPVIDVIQPVSPTGRYLIVPPDWKGTPPEGFVVATPRTTRAGCSCAATSAKTAAPPRPSPR